MQISTPDLHRHQKGMILKNCIRKQKRKAFFASGFTQIELFQSPVASLIWQGSQAAVQAWILEMLSHRPPFPFRTAMEKPQGLTDLTGKELNVAP